MEFHDGTSIYTAGTEGHIFVAFHGAGHSALSFACIAREIKNFARLIAFDFRGHGLNKMEEEKSEGDEGMEMYSETLVADSVGILRHINEKYPDTSIIIIGHRYISHIYSIPSYDLSMGGAIAAKTLQEARKIPEIEPNLKGLIIIDVIEGTAIEALPFMESIVTSRPKKFKTMEQAIRWK